MSRNMEKGVTLVELMVALVISLILIAGIYTLYRSTQDTYIGQEKLVELQQNSRITLEEVTREMRLGGYLAGCDPTVATETAFEFEADTDLDGTAERIQYLYINDPDDPDYKTLKRAPGTAGSPCTPLADPDFETVATNINLIHFDYYDAGNQLLASPVTNDDTNGNGTPDLSDIRRVTIRLEASTTDPLTNTTKTVSLMSDVRLRNLGIAEAGGCPRPKAPSGLAGVDIQVCNRARATWNPNKAADQVTGYRLYSKLAGTSNWAFINDVDATSTSFTKTDLVNGSTYEFAVAARNNCGLGPESSSVTVGPLNDDIAPQVPTWLDPGATAVSDGNTVTLTWDASVTTDYQGNPVSAEDGGTDVAGYNVFRSGTQANGALLAGTSFTDTVPIACTVYDYQVRAQDTCGNISALSDAAYGDANLAGGVQDSPVNRTTNTRPAETVAPSDPTDLVAISGGRYPATGSPPTYRITLSWKHATEVDVQGTRIRYKEKNTACAAGDYPSGPTSNTLLVDETGEPGAAESHNYDIFTNNKYYCFTAFAYDACTNYSSGTQATAQAKTCGDDPVGVPSPIDVGSLKLGVSDQGVKCCDVSSTENRATATIEWTTTQNLVNTPDLAGFNVYRRPAPTGTATFNYNGETYYLITAAPYYDPTGETSEFPDNTDDNQNTCVSFGTDLASDTTVGGDDLADEDGINGGPDGICNSTANSNPVGSADDVQIASVGAAQDPYRTLKLLPGVTYKYIIRVVDCKNQESTVNQSVTYKPGKVNQDTTVDATVTGTKSRQYNIVNLALKNTSASDLTLRNALDGQADTATMTWVNSLARLTKIQVDGTTLWEDTSANPTTTSGTALTFTGNKTLTGLATAKTMILTFKDSTGKTNTVDMRGDTMTVSLSFRNETVYTSSVNNSVSTCSVTFSFTTASGVTLSNTTQDPPKDPSDPSIAATPKKSSEVGVPPGWYVPTNQDVVITTKATPSSGGTVVSVTLNYYADSSFLSAAPDPATTTYTALPMGCVSGTPPNCGGNQWTATIPVQSGMRVWFYIEAVSGKGQHTTDPLQTEISFIAYTYDPQKLKVNPLFGSWNLTDVDNPLTLPDESCPAPDEAVVNGTVLDQSGAPISGATVSISITGGGSYTNLTSTDASGNFAFNTGYIFFGDAIVTVTASKTTYDSRTCSLTIPFASCTGETTVVCN